MAAWNPTTKTHPHHRQTAPLLSTSKSTWSSTGLHPWFSAKEGIFFCRWKTAALSFQAEELLCQIMDIGFPVLFLFPELLSLRRASADFHLNPWGAVSALRRANGTMVTGAQEKYLPAPTQRSAFASRGESRRYHR